MRNAWVVTLVAALLAGSLGLGSGYLIFTLQSKEFQVEEARISTQKMRQEIENLQEKEKKLLSEKEALESNIGKLVSRLDRFNMSLGDSQKENQAVRQQISELQVALRDMARGLVAQTEELRVQSKNRDLLEANMTKQIALIQSNVANLTKQTQTLQGRVTILTQKISDLEEGLKGQRPVGKPVYVNVRAYNFDADMVGSAPPRWTTISGSWNVVSDVTASSPPNSYKQTLPNSGTTYLTLEDADYDFTKGAQISWKMKTLNSAGRGWARFGIVFLYQDPNNYYTIFRDDNGGNNNYIHVLKVVNGVTTDLKAVNPGGTTTGTWRTFEVTLSTSGSQIAIQWNLDGWNDSLSDVTPWRSGKVGLRASSESPSTAEVAFDDVVIKYQLVQ